MCAFVSHPGPPGRGRADFCPFFGPFGAPLSPPWLHFRPLVASLGCVLGILALRFGFRCSILVFVRAFWLILVVFGGILASI